jgi:hypothetical protein
MGQSEKSLSQEASRDGVTEVPNEASWTPDFERKLVRKMDIHIIPALWMMNLLSWMDRAK